MIATATAQVNFQCQYDLVVRMDELRAKRVKVLNDALREYLDKHAPPPTTPKTKMEDLLS